MYYLVKDQGIKKLQERVSELDLYGKVNGHSCGATFLVFDDYSIIEESECVELTLQALMTWLLFLKAYLTIRVKHWLNKLNPDYVEPF